MRYNTSLAVLVLSLTGLALSACAHKEWNKKGVDQNTRKQDQSDCVAIAEAKAKKLYPELLAHPLTDTFGMESKHSAFRDINRKNYNRAKVEFSYECMLEKGYQLE